MGQNSTMRLANEEKTDIKSEICWVEKKHFCLKIVSTFWCHQKVDKVFSPFKHPWLPYAGTKSVYLVQGLWLSNLCSHLESYRRQSVYFMTSHRLSTFWWHVSTLWWHTKGRQYFTLKVSTLCRDQECLFSAGIRTWLSTLWCDTECLLSDAFRR